MKSYEYIKIDRVNKNWVYVFINGVTPCSFQVKIPLGKKEAHDLTQLMFLAIAIREINNALELCLGSKIVKVLDEEHLEVFIDMMERLELRSVTMSHVLCFDVPLIYDSRKYRLCDIKLRQPEPSKLSRVPRDTRQRVYSHIQK